MQHSSVGGLTGAPMGITYSLFRANGTFTKSLPSPSSTSAALPLPCRSLARIQFATTLPRRKRFIKISFLATLSTTERAREEGREKGEEREGERRARRNYQADRAIMTAQRARVIAFFVLSQPSLYLLLLFLLRTTGRSCLLNRLTCSALPWTRAAPSALRRYANRESCFKRRLR